MDLLQLEAFVQVSLLGSFTRASEALGVTQPVLSRRIRGLEVELKQSLLMRTGRGVELTEAGRRLLTHGQEILAQVDRARLDLREARDSPVGHVTLSIPASIAPIITIEIVRQFESRFPRATLAVTESPSAQTNEWISTGRVDLAISYSPMPSPRVEVDLLVKQSLSLIGPASNSEWRELAGGTIKVEQLANYPIILPTRRHSVRLHFESLMANAGIRPTFTWEIDSFYSVMELIRAGYGYTVVPESIVHWYVKPTEIIARRLEPELTIPLALNWPAQRALTPLARQTLDLVRELVRALLAEPSSPQGSPLAE